MRAAVQTIRAAWLRRLAASGAVAASCLAFTGAANASVGTPLTIKRFALQATSQTVIREVTSGLASGVEFVNEPYTPPFSQAGAHPWALTTTGDFETEPFGHFGGTLPTRDVKDIVVDIPPGLVGDPLAVPRCPLRIVTTTTSEQCPDDTQVGYYVLRLKGRSRILAPIVNVTPEAGQSAEFALENQVKIQVPLLTAHLVRAQNPSTGRLEYELTVVSKSIPLLSVEGFELTFWGVPADPSHDLMRGLFCATAAPDEPFEIGESGTCSSYPAFTFHPQPAGIVPVPFLSLPSSCSSGPETATMRADSWEEPGTVGVGGEYRGFAEASAALPAVTGCGLLQFDSGTGVVVEPDTFTADEPVGLGVKLNVPLNELPGQNATPNLRETRITLPEGMSVSPGVVDGIEACDATGPHGINIDGPESEYVGQDGEWHLAPGHCPDASIVGSAEAISPFLPEPVKGHVYLARPECGGAGEPACTEQDALDGKLYKLYLELGGAGKLADTGIEFKVPLQTEANPATGQLTSISSDLAQLPYDEVVIHLNSGPRAPLDNPASCGEARTTADFKPWSAPGLTPEGSFVAGTPDLLSSSRFTVTGCSSPTPFAPGFTAGTVTPNAGQFSSFTMDLSRADREQFVKGIQVHTPPGLLAMLSSVPLCGEPAANAGTCPQTSKIGTTRVASGAGSHPFEIEGSVYLTGPHDGAPFGLSIVTHAQAGPFNLGLVVVRARIDIDPHSSTATITTDETGPYAVPQIVFGVPLRLQRITVNIDRPGFMFNPTNCKAQRITATISGNQNATAAVSSPFAAGACRSLAFKPHFAVTTSGRTSRRRGASLDVKLTYPRGAMGADANVAKVRVELPKQLPSRLETLKRACLAETFAANPAACPRESIVGIVRTRTPVLPVPLSGPAYFVSHGGAEFPSLVVVLQGDGVRVDLEGETFIDKRTDITSSTFKTVPDVPVESFELYLPEGRYSALAANGNLCKAKGGLRMPTEFTAQNGAVVKQRTKIAVSGCGKHERRHKARKAARAGQGRSGR